MILTATYVVVNKALEVAKVGHVATISLFIGCFVLTGWGLNYTIQRFTPASTGRKECRGTLFPASVTREIGGTQRSMPAYYWEETV